MLKDRKPIPIAFSLLSILYFIYVVSSGSSKMIGDDIGGDPGGMVLPLFLSIFMFAASVYLLLTDKKVPGKNPKMTPQERHLFILTFAFAIAYVLCMRFLGFILCTVLLLFFLCYANQRKGLYKDDFKVAAVGAVASLGGILGIYSICRVLTRSLLIAGRRGTIPSWLGSSAMTSTLSMLITVICIVLAIIVCRKFWPAGGRSERAHACWFSAVIAVATTETLYIIFKQLFLVELVKGLITW